ncbi:Alpha/Beta hydrolase protein [Scenedesmus sp. NREL 46B-D3]|nr:Alpha/Beta hydrolase protein [Scenedesmus sp. NREL 46B-D3]
MRGYTVVLLAVVLLCTHLACAQTVLDALTGLWAGNQGSVQRGAVNLARLAARPQQSNITLPQCKTTSVLLNRGGFPRNWAEMQPQEQVLHPINLVMMQLAYAVYYPPALFRPCLQAMGIVPNSIRVVEATVPEYNTLRTAYVMLAANQRIFVLVRGSVVTRNELTRDVTVNLACRHVQPPEQTFGIPGSDIRLHRGFYRAWQVLEPGVTSIVQAYLKQVPSGEVYLVGHSLGAAVASIAALRLRAVLAAGRAKGKVSGVWLFASPRPGNAAFAQAYNSALLSRTLRMTNTQDFAARLPYPVQACSINNQPSQPAFIDFNALFATTARFTFAHVGRAVLMCPEPRSGLTYLHVYPQGSEVVDCGSGSDEVDASGATHQLGSYLDAWRRGYVARKGSNLANDPRLLSVLCWSCTHRTETVLEQIAVPARAGGPVTCAADASCSMQRAFAAATAVGNELVAPFSRGTSTCVGFVCS